MAESQREADEFRVRNAAKCGNYTGEDCPNCGRSRVLLGNDQKRRCEKCQWCIEDGNYDGELVRYLRGAL